MKKSKLILTILLSFLPTLVYAESTPTDTFDLSTALFMESFVTIFMSLFVFRPLANNLAEEKRTNPKKLFWKMFWIRIAILLFFDLFLTTDIAIIDFFGVFIGAILVVVISVTNKSLEKYNFNIEVSNIPKSVQTPTCSKCGKQLDLNNKFCIGCGEPIPNSNVSTTNLNTPNSNVQNAVELSCSYCGKVITINDQTCPGCGAPIEGDNIVVKTTSNAITTPVPGPKEILYSKDFDPMYNYSESFMLQEFINRQLIKVGINKDDKLIPEEALKRKKIMNLIFTLLVFIYVSLIFFHFPISTYVIGLIALIIFYMVTSRFNLLKYLSKKVKERPSEKISNIIMSVKPTLVIDNSKKLFISSFCLAIILPLVIFYNPRILYEKMDNGYGVRFYTFGLSNFTTATIPGEYNGEKVISLRGNSFSNMPFLKKVKLPDTITEIRGQAFKNDYNLTEVNIPKKLEYLGGGSFYNCSSIKSIEIPDTVTFIGGEAFYGAESLESVKLSNNISEIRGNTFENCFSLKRIDIPDKVTRIGGHAFYGCSDLSEVKFTENSKLNEIGSSAFRQCDSLYEITLPDNDININQRAFKESPTNIKFYGEFRSYVIER